MITYDGLTVSTIRSGKGDCIHLRFIGDSLIPHNVIIDSGPTSTAAEFRRLTTLIQSKGESLDVLLITHYDDDHIGCILKVGDPGFDRIYFNAYAGTKENTNLSAIQSQRLFHLLAGTKVHTTVIVGDVIELDGAKLTIVSPTIDMLSKALAKMEEADKELSLLSDWNYSLDELMVKPYSDSDTSLSNQASIVCIFEYHSYRFLFCGDAWPAAIPSGKFNLVKLSHHGSIKNISKQLLERLDVDSFLICSNGVHHPNKMTIAKLLQCYKKIVIYSNYSWWMNNFLKSEDIKYINNGQLVFKEV